MRSNHQLITTMTRAMVVVGMLVLAVVCLSSPAIAGGPQNYQTPLPKPGVVATPFITTMFFDQGTIYAPSIIVAFGPAGLPSKMRFTLQHPATGSLQDIYCVRPYLGVCNSVSSSSSIGAGVNVSGVVDSVSLEWYGQNLSFQ